jgi:hypothetical protein
MLLAQGAVVIKIGEEYVAAHHLSSQTSSKREPL